MTKTLERIRSVAVYCGALSPPNPCYAEAAARLGAFIADNGMTLVFGGAATGLMKVLADAALARGGRVVGVFTDGLAREILHTGLTETVFTNSLAERKAEMLRRADAIVALPGGFGTWDELFDALALRRKKNGHKAPIGVLNVNGYFDLLLAFIAHSVDEGFVSPRRLQLLKSGRTPEALFKQLAGSLAPNVGRPEFRE